MFCTSLFLLGWVLAKIIPSRFEVALTVFSLIIFCKRSYLSQNYLSYLRTYNYGILSDYSSHSCKRDGLLPLLNMRRSPLALHHFRLVDCTYTSLPEPTQSALFSNNYNEGYSTDCATKACFLEVTVSVFPFDINSHKSTLRSSPICQVLPYFNFIWSSGLILSLEDFSYLL